MTYQGQLIYTTELGHSLAFNNYRQQVRYFTRFLQTMFILLSVLVILRGRTSFSIQDYAIWIGFSVLVVFFLQSMIGRFETTDEIEEGEALLSIFEYGIILPRDLTDQEEDLYLTYNQLNEIAIEEDGIVISNDQTYTIPYFFLADDALDTVIGLFEKIAKKVAEVENREYPTIIPRAYFREIISDHK